MFRLKKNKLHGRGRKLHTEEINNLYISFTVAWMIKLERDRLDAQHSKEKQETQNFGWEASWE